MATDRRPPYSNGGDPRRKCGDFHSCHAPPFQDDPCKDDFRREEDFEKKCSPTTSQRIQYPHLTRSHLGGRLPDHHQRCRSGGTRDLHYSQLPAGVLHLRLLLPPPAALQRAMEWHASKRQSSRAIASNEWCRLKHQREYIYDVTGIIYPY